MSKEVLRYLGMKQGDEKTERLIEEMKAKVKELTPSFVNACFTIKKSEKGIELVGTEIVLKGNLAKNHFCYCEKVIVFLATLGLKSEILSKQIFAKNAEKGVILDAVYTDKLEKYLDKIQHDLVKSYNYSTTRISCGYADLSIDIQKQLFDAIQGYRLGVEINDCYMLYPNKSVIAIVGVK